MEIDNIVDDLFDKRDLSAYQMSHAEYEHLATDYPGRRDNKIATAQDNHKRYDIMDKLFVDNY